MIQPSTVLPASTGAMPFDLVRIPVGESPDLGGFLQVLAGQVEAAANDAIPTGTENLTIAAGAGDPAEPGKILPLTLPVPDQPLAVPLAVALANPVVPFAEGFAPVHPDRGPHGSAAPAVASGPQAAEPAPARPDAPVRPAINGLPQPAVPLSPRSHTYLPPQNAVQTASAEAPVQPARPLPTAPAEEVRLTIVAPVAAKLASPVRENGQPAFALEQPAPATPLPAHAPQQQPQTGAALATSPASAIPAHDFAALVDRLAAAREASAPQTVSITVAHQDFGPVRMRFRTEEAGLAVTMSSADPEFARVAAAAPVLPTGASEQAGAALSHRGEGAAPQAGNGGSFAQPRQRSTDRSELPANQDTLSDAPSQHQRNRAAARHGIFA